MRDTCSLIRGIFVLPILAITVGCGGPPGYVFSAARGQLDFISRAQPIEVALQDPTLTAEQQDKLAFVVRARDYARDVVGLNIGNSYQEFVNLHGEPLAWNLSGSRKDAFEPVTWTFAFVGTYPYLGFFSLSKAKAERDRLKAMNYDTMLYELDTYAIPVLPDPITSAMLERSHISLADTVMHELLHNTIIRPSATEFNESLATFVGREAGVEFLVHEFGADSEIVTEASGHYEDDARFHSFIQETIDELEIVYGNDASFEQKLTEREAVFESARLRFKEEVLPAMNDPERYAPFAEFPLNNAFLLASVRYNNNLDLYDAVHDTNDRDWSRTLAVFGQAAQHDDPEVFLQQWLTP